MLTIIIIIAIILIPALTRSIIDDIRLKSKYSPSEVKRIKKAKGLGVKGISKKNIKGNIISFLIFILFSLSQAGLIGLILMIQSSMKDEYLGSVIATGLAVLIPPIDLVGILLFIRIKKKHPKIFKPIDRELRTLVEDTEENYIPQNITAGVEFIEVSEQMETDFIVTKVENGYIYAKAVVDKEKQMFGMERGFKREDLIFGNDYFSYIFRNKSE